MKSLRWQDAISSFLSPALKGKLMPNVSLCFTLDNISAAKRDFLMTGHSKNSRCTTKASALERSLWCHCRTLLHGMQAQYLPSMLIQKDSGHHLAGPSCSGILTPHPKQGHGHFTKCSDSKGAPYGRPVLCSKDVWHVLLWRAGVRTSKQLYCWKTGWQHNQGSNLKLSD